MKPTSIDPKPLWAPHCTIIQEDDTKDIYCFDAMRRVWVKIGSTYWSTLSAAEKSLESMRERMF